MEITSKMVGELRDRTNLPMMKCKQALTACGGDMQAAIDWLRKQGLSAADKRAGRATKAGSIGMAIGNGKALAVILASETDFVGSNAEFKALAQAIADAAMAAGATTLEAVQAVTMKDGRTVADAVVGILQKMGENIRLADVKVVEGATVVGYNHGGRLVTMLAGTGDSKELRLIAMHAAAANPAPVAVRREEIDPAILTHEREVLMQTAEVLAKPEAMRGKIVDGKMGRFFKERVLLEQEMLIEVEPKGTAGDFAKAKGLTVTTMARLEIGG